VVVLLHSPVPSPDSKILRDTGLQLRRATKDNPLQDSDRFMLALSQIAGKRLTYAELTGKVEETRF
jgi:hypothetical protein